MNPEQIKKYVLELGAQNCGIASVERFKDAPTGFHPKDIFNQCKSVVVFTKQMPTGMIFAENPIPYTHAAYKMYEELDRIAMELCRFFQKNKIKAVIIPADVPYLHWEQENMYGHGILSLKHSAVHAGLGFMGRSTIFIDKEFGNMVYIGAVLIDKEIELDPLIQDLKCPTGCSKCIDVCPAHAMDGVTVNQKLCREKSFIQAGRGWDLYNCNACRKVCPYFNGKNNKY